MPFLTYILLFFFFKYTVLPNTFPDVSSYIKCVNTRKNLPLPNYNLLDLPISKVRRFMTRNRLFLMFLIYSLTILDWFLYLLFLPWLQINSFIVSTRSYLKEVMYSFFIVPELSKSFLSVTNLCSHSVFFHNNKYICQTFGVFSYNSFISGHVSCFCVRSKSHFARDIF